MEIIQLPSTFRGAQTGWLFIFCQNSRKTLLTAGGRGGGGILLKEAALNVNTDMGLKPVSCQEKVNWRVEQETMRHYLPIYL